MAANGKPLRIEPAQLEREARAIAEAAFDARTRLALLRFVIDAAPNVDLIPRAAFWPELLIEDLDRELRAIHEKASEIHFALQKPEGARLAAVPAADELAETSEKEKA